MTTITCDFCKKEIKDDKERVEISKPFVISSLVYYAGQKTILDVHQDCLDPLIKLVKNHQS